LPDISWWPDWSKIRKDLQKSYLPFSVDLKKTSVFKHKDVFVILSDLIITSSDKTSDAGTRKFFVSDKGDQFRIVCEKHLSRVNGQNDESRKNPLIATCRDLKRLLKEEDQDIPKMIDGWLKAWSAKDIKRYGDYYASNFRSPGGASLKNWLKYKERLNQKYDYIRVSMNNLVINNGKNTCQVSFIQTYESSGLKATGLKRLTLIREGGLWKIYKETWKKK